MTFIFFNKYPRKRQGPVEIGRLSSPPTLSPRYVGSQKPSEARGREGEGVDEEGGGGGRRALPDRTPFLKSQVLRVYSLAFGVCAGFWGIFWSLAANFGAKVRARGEGGRANSCSSRWRARGSSGATTDERGNNVATILALLWHAEPRRRALARHGNYAEASCKCCNLSPAKSFQLFNLYGRTLRTNKCVDLSWNS